MSSVIIDIETISYPFESFDEVQQEYLLKFSETEEQKKDAILKLSLYPTTAQIVTIGMYNPETGHGLILFQSDEKLNYTSEEGSIKYITGSEAEILEMFWQNITKYNQFITFNGRAFDCPFIMLRSAILKIKPTRNLMPYRYDSKIHCDLLEQLTYYSVMRKFNLDFYCKTFGIDSPKSHGVTGLDVQKLFEEKKFKEIAEYNLHDLKSTAELYNIWKNYLNV